MSLPSGVSATMVRMTSEPDGMLSGASRVTDPLALLPLPTNKTAGNVESRLLELVARMVMFSSDLLEATVKGTEVMVPAVKMLSESA